jgi:hypothetical protein
MCFPVRFLITLLASYIDFRIEKIELNLRARSASILRPPRLQAEIHFMPFNNIILHKREPGKCSKRSGQKSNTPAILILRLPFISTDIYCPRGARAATFYEDCTFLFSFYLSA